KQDIQYRREGYFQDNMDKPMIDAIEESYRKWKNDPARRNGAGEEGGRSSLDARSRQRSKVVFISFSWELHDQNTRMLHKRKDGEGKEDRTGEDQQQTLLGEDYTYTLFLVSDNDPVKSIARIQSERKDLSLFFQMIMRQIWMDKLNEYEYLVKRSQSISGSLHQFIHRVKHLIPDHKKQKEMEDFHENLKVLMAPKRPTMKWRAVPGPGRLFAMLLGENPDGGMDESGFRDRLLEKSKELIGAMPREARPVHIRVFPSPLPRLRVMWSSAVVRDAFNVSFKNAVEAALGATRPGRGEIFVQLQAAPRDLERDRDKWFLDIVIENTGGPISPALLERLNAPDPAAVGKNESKSTSTGIGVFLSRFQLKEVIRMGADLILANVGDQMVECRLRLPAKHIRPRREEISAGIEMKAPEGDYLLY
ncbi:MAG: sensor histidine kinase, partial [Desulfobacterales bacterium]|nr:sensor histidine kinase [Desulfobacterales bacterium]